MSESALLNATGSERVKPLLSLRHITNQHLALEVTVKHWTDELCSMELDTEHYKYCNSQDKNIKYINVCDESHAARPATPVCDRN
jgi:hypothetical protein